MAPNKTRAQRGGTGSPPGHGEAPAASLDGQARGRPSPHQIAWTKQTERESRLPGKPPPFCWAKHRATKRRVKSPITMPRTRPFGFWRATMRPRPRALAASLGTAACATSCVTRTNRSEASSSSRSTRARNGSLSRALEVCGKAPHTARLWAPVGITKLLQSLGGAWGQHTRRQRLSCRGQFSKVHKMACALGSGHRWLKWLGFFQELGPPPLIKRRKACNPLMLGQLPNTRTAMQQHAWQQEPQLPGSHGSLLVGSRVEDGRQSKGQGVTHGTADKRGNELESASTALECLQQIHGVKLHQRPLELPIRRRRRHGVGRLWLAVGVLAAWPKGRGRLLCWELSGRGL